MSFECLEEGEERFGDGLRNLLAGGVTGGGSFGVLSNDGESARDRFLGCTVSICGGCGSSEDGTLAA